MNASQMIQSICFSLLTLVCLAAVFCPLERFSRAVRFGSLWRKHQTGTDILHWLITGALAKPAAGAILTGIATFTFCVQGKPYLHINYDGFGPVVLQPTWLIVIELLLITDLLGYWRHRWMHTKGMWKVHAIHHSSVDLYWLSAIRFHPVDVVFQHAFYLLVAFFLGFPLSTVAVYIPFVTLMNFLYHSNLDWALGPLRYIIVTPAFHRWHHTLQEEGQNKNFATIFSFYDILFGTYFCPENRRAREFGISGGSAVPSGYVGQLYYPFADFFKRPN